MKRFTLLLVGAMMLAGFAPAASAALIQIQMGGVDLSYDGVNLVDGGASDPDPLTGATFLVDGFQPGPTDTLDVARDLDIAVTNIPAAGGQVSTTGGTLDLYLGGTEFISLVLDSSSVTYIPVTSTIQYVFVGSTASSTGQDLPYEISIDDPISISISTQIVEPVTSSGGRLTFFKAAGTGEIQGFGVGIPEPATLALLGVGGLMMVRRRRR